MQHRCVVTLVVNLYFDAIMNSLHRNLVAARNVRSPRQLHKREKLSEAQSNIRAKLRWIYLMDQMHKRGVLQRRQNYALPHDSNTEDNGELIVVSDIGVQQPTPRRHITAPDWLDDSTDDSPQEQQREMDFQLGGRTMVNDTHIYNYVNRLLQPIVSKVTPARAPMFLDTLWPYTTDVRNVGRESALSISKDAIYDSIAMTYLRAYMSGRATLSSSRCVVLPIHEQHPYNTTPFLDNLRRRCMLPHPAKDTVGHWSLVLFFPRVRHFVHLCSVRNEYARKTSPDLSCSTSDDACHTQPTIIDVDEHDPTFAFINAPEARVAAVSIMRRFIGEMRMRSLVNHFDAIFASRPSSERKGLVAVAVDRAFGRPFPREWPSLKSITEHFGLSVDEQRAFYRHQPQLIELDAHMFLADHQITYSVLTYKEPQAMDMFGCGIFTIAMMRALVLGYPQGQGLLAVARDIEEAALARDGALSDDVGRISTTGETTVCSIIELLYLAQTKRQVTDLMHALAHTVDNKLVERMRKTLSQELDEGTLQCGGPDDALTDGEVHIDRIHPGIATAVFNTTERECERSAKLQRRVSKPR